MRWADRSGARWARVAAVAILAALAAGIAATSAQAGDPLLDLIPAKVPCHAVTLDRGPEQNGSVVVTLTVSKACEKGVHVSRIRVDFDDQSSN